MIDKERELVCVAAESMESLDRDMSDVEDKETNRILIIELTLKNLKERVAFLEDERYGDAMAQVGPDSLEKRVSRLEAQHDKECKE